MRITFFSAKPYDRETFNRLNESFGFELIYFETHLGPHIINAVDQTDAVCAFVNDKLNAEVLNELALKGVKVVAMRCAGFNNVDLEVAKRLGIRICRVPAYSPEAVAEHAVAMLLTLNRKTHKAYNRVREQNFSLNGLLGFNVHGKTVGVLGTGNIGTSFCKIMLGFGCRVVAFDLMPNPELSKLGVTYLPKEEVFKCADILSLHCPLNESTHHIINREAIALMKKGVMLVNTSRGGLIDTKAAIDALKSKQIGYLGLDVYEHEGQLFFRDLSANIIEDDTIQRLMSFPNVLITAHQAFLTEEALRQIAVTTLKSVHELLHGESLSVKSALVV
ncbi:MAG: 2-hydroxyacid dehydrogenase [Cyclobacteriaceae bacterium]|nr:2-hydroxyacid dehydrogenase [Cyclobacteriaceae bacterium]